MLGCCFSLFSAAYKHADGKKIDGRRILVDVERGRTVKGWRPRRLGGGLGNTRKGGADVNTKYSGRDDFVGRDRNVPDDRKSLEVHSMRDERPPRGGSPDRFRRSTRSRERSRERRRPRSRSRERRRRGSRERRRSPEREIKKEPIDESEVPPAEAGEMEDKKPPRDDGARKRRRSRSRERRRSRSPRDRERKRGRRSRSRERRGSKPRDRNRGEKDAGDAGTEANGDSGVFIKQEVDDKEYEGAYDAAGDQFQNYDNAGGTEYPNYEDA